eukprot:7991592-Alexandrium_andersonii.AAC.1
MASTLHNWWHTWHRRHWPDTSVGAGLGAATMVAGGDLFCDVRAWLAAHDRISLLPDAEAGAVLASRVARRA